MRVLAVESRVERVVVHDNGALVTRVVSVPVGATKIAVAGLPLRLMDDSLRVRAVSGGIVTGLIEERCTATITKATPQVGREALLKNKLALEEVRRQRHTIDTLRKVDVIDVELPPAKDHPTLVSLTALLDLNDGVHHRQRALNEADAKLVEQERALMRELRELEAAASLVEESPPRVLRGVEMAVTAPDGGMLELDYFVTAARWVPSYELHLRRTEGRVVARLSLGALIAQASGEDWHDAIISVATTSLSRAATLPVVHSWRLGRAQPAKTTGYRPLPSDLPRLFSGFDRFPQPPAPMAPSTPRPAKSRPHDLPPEPPAPPPPPPRPMPQMAPPPPMMAAPMPASAPMLERMEPMPSMRDDGMAMKRRSSAPSPMSAPRGGARPPGASTGSFAIPDAPAASVAYDEDADMAFADEGGFGALAGGGGGGGGGNVVDELPPRLRASGLRMTFADEGPRRGQLVSMDLRERLAWLLDTADVHGVDLDVEAVEAQRASVHRAYDALVEAERRLDGRALPPGTARTSGAVARIFGGAGGRRASIKSDGTEHRVLVHSEESPAKLVHASVPREAKDVYRFCVFQPQGPLPVGPLQVFEDDAFVVAGTVRQGAGATTRFNLGIDPDVRVESRTVHINQSEKGLMSGTSVVEHTVSLVVRSTKNEPVDLTIHDRLPVPGHEVKDVTIAVGACKPPIKQTDRGPDGNEVKGAFNIDVRLMPGDKQTIEHSYTLTLPAKLELVGGNRRE